jgi:hypothetical protein
LKKYKQQNRRGDDNKVEGDRVLPPGDDGDQTTNNEMIARQS